MKTLLILLAILLIAAGVAVGLMNIFSPGTVIVGLNLDVAATLFTGGCVLLGLGVVAGNLSAMIGSEVNDGAEDDYAPPPSTKPDLPEFMVPPPVSAAAGAAAAATSSAAYGDASGERTDAAAHAADKFEKAADAVVHEAADSTFTPATETAAEVAEHVTETTDQAAEKARDDLSSFFARAPQDAQDPDADTPPVFTGTHEGPPIARDAPVKETDAEESQPAARDTEEEAKPGKADIFPGSPGKAASKSDADEVDTPALDTAKTGPDEQDKAATEEPKLKPFAVETPAVEAHGSQPDEADAATAADDADAATAADDTDAATAADDADAATAADDTDAATAADDTDAATEESPEALPQEEELFVVEERVIRERPARLLSDGTVEAETDEGWMRFENVEHVEEYLDAMKATA